MNGPIDASYDPVADPINDPVAYDQASRTHTIYSEDFGLIGTRLYTVYAFMTEQPHITSLPDAEAYITIVDPCLDPESVTATAQTDPQVYDYTGINPTAQFYLNPFIVEPPVCSFTYSCNVIAGDRLDLCFVIDGAS